ncbi:hypothetical protein SUGI_0632200 [Cryptomeria japonica]|nr:hypothetical protein SUGI_0632200 [Cryptomeria japonica]
MASPSSISRIKRTSSATRRIMSGSEELETKGQTLHCAIPDFGPSIKGTTCRMKRRCVSLVSEQESFLCFYSRTQL